VITLEEAKQLKYGDILVNSDGKRWKVSGKVVRWVLNPDRIRVPLKHGLYVYGELVSDDFRDGICEYLTKEG
jgi:hypothetical protein